MKLTVSQTGDDICTLEKEQRIDNKKEHLSRYFNEAVLHLVRFVILIEIISTVRNKQKPSLLVLDDCFNSLDAANRTFLMRYLLQETKGTEPADNLSPLTEDEVHKISTKLSDAENDTETDIEAESTEDNAEEAPEEIVPVEADDGEDFPVVENRALGGGKGFVLDPA